MRPRSRGEDQPAAQPASLQPLVRPGRVLQTLRTLERDGLVSRTLTPGVPARVDYALTPLGESLMPAVNAIKAWAEEHMSEIAASRTAYDDRQRNSVGG